MIKYGDKFVLTKDYGVAKKGSVFEVNGFDIESGIVSMGTTYGVVCVDSDAMRALFVPLLGTIYNDKQPVNKKREWSKWKAIDYLAECDPVINDIRPFTDILYDEYIYNKNIIYRTNGKRTEVRIICGINKFEGHATCNKCDTFDINMGVTIATYRALKKLIDGEIEKVIAND